MGRAVVACFVEDFATESFVGALIERLASEESTSVSVRFLLARGGASVVKTRFEAYQRAQQKGLLVGGRPDLLVLVTDCDCRPLATCRAELEALVDDSVFAEHVIGAPTSHVEAWYLADGESFFEVVGAEPPPPPRKCAKDVHKKRLEEAVKAGGHPLTNGGAEFGPDLIAAMDLRRAAAAEPTLDLFIRDVRLALKRVNRLLAGPTVAGAAI
jgi:hypothetical protein